VQDLEAVHHDSFVHACSEREIVRRILEQRIAADVYFVEENVREKIRQPERLPVGYEMDLVSARSESNAQLGRYGARAAIRWIAGNADLQEVSFHQR
jgi:hypothetical protein